MIYLIRILHNNPIVFNMNYVIFYYTNIYKLHKYIHLSEYITSHQLLADAWGILSEMTKGLSQKPVFRLGDAPASFDVNALTSPLSAQQRGSRMRQCDR